MMNEHFDVIVVGAGAVGSVLATHWARAGRKVAVIEARASRLTAGDDPRILALSAKSCAMLEAIGVDLHDAPQINRVHVSQQGALGRLLLTTDDVDLPFLGKTVAYSVLDAFLDQVLEAQPLQLFRGFRAQKVKNIGSYAALEIENDEKCRLHLTARLIVAADGGALVSQLNGVRQYSESYEQTAILAHLGGVPEHERATAYERFAVGGAFALLPTREGWMWVLTRSSAEAQRCLAWSDDEFLQQFQRLTNGRFPDVTLQSSPVVVPLQAKWVSALSQGRVVLVGNAAQTLHPVAAQGLNLGLRDAEDLLQASLGVRDLGEAKVLANFAARRRLDRFGVMSLTHTLATRFEGAHWMGRWARGLGLALLDGSQAARRSFVQHLIFGLA